MAGLCVASGVLRLSLISFRRMHRLLTVIFTPVVRWRVWMGRAMMMTWVTWPAPPATMWHGTEWKAAPALRPGVEALLLKFNLVAAVSAAEEGMVRSSLFEAGDPVPEGGCLVVVID